MSDWISSLRSKRPIFQHERVTSKFEYIGWHNYNFQTNEEIQYFVALGLTQGRPQPLRQCKNGMTYLNLFENSVQGLWNRHKVSGGKGVADLEKLLSLILWPDQWRQVKPFWRYSIVSIVHMAYILVYSFWSEAYLSNWILRLDTRLICCLYL